MDALYEAEILLHTILPKAAPFYIIGTSDNPPDGLLPAGASGVSGVDLDLSLQSFIEDGGGWSGRGSAMIIDDTQLKAKAMEAADGDGESAAALSRKAIMCVCLHEQAHILNFAVECDRGEHAAAETEDEAQAASHVSAAAWEDADLLARLPEWYAHDGQWLRAAIHLWARATRVRCELPLDWILGCAERELSSEDAYLDAIKGELTRLQDFDLKTILILPPPKAFAELWRRDVQAWFKANQSTAGRLAAYVCAKGINLYSTVVPSEAAA